FPSKSTQLEAARLIECDPACSAMAKTEQTRMQNLRHNFSRLDQPRSRSVEEMMAVNEADSTLLHCPKIGPRRILREQIQILDGLRNLESARQEKDDFWIGFDQTCPID